MVRGKRAITPDTALRLSRYFGTTAELWLGLQMEYELRRARRAQGDRVQREIEPLRPGAAA